MPDWCSLCRGLMAGGTLRHRFSRSCSILHSAVRGFGNLARLSEHTFRARVNVSPCPDRTSPERRWTACACGGRAARGVAVDRQTVAPASVESVGTFLTLAVLLGGMALTRAERRGTALASIRAGPTGVPSCNRAPCSPPVTRRVCCFVLTKGVEARDALIGVGRELQRSIASTSEQARFAAAQRTALSLHRAA